MSMRRANMPTANEQYQQQMMPSFSRGQGGAAGFVTESGFGVASNGVVGYAEEFAPQLAAGMQSIAPMPPVAQKAAQSEDQPSFATSVMSTLGLITSNRDAVKHMEANAASVNMRTGRMHDGADGRGPSTAAFVHIVKGMHKKARTQNYYKLLVAMTRDPTYGNLYKYVKGINMAIVHVMHRNKGKMRMRNHHRSGNSLLTTRNLVVDAINSFPDPNMFPEDSAERRMAKEERETMILVIMGRVMEITKEERIVESILNFLTQVFQMLDEFAKKLLEAVMQIVPVNFVNDDTRTFQQQMDVAIANLWSAQSEQENMQYSEGLSNIATEYTRMGELIKMLDILARNHHPVYVNTSDPLLVTKITKTISEMTQFEEMRDEVRAVFRETFNKAVEKNTELFRQAQTRYHQRSYKQKGGGKKNKNRAKQHAKGANHETVSKRMLEEVKKAAIEGVQSANQVADRKIRGLEKKVQNANSGNGNRHSKAKNKKGRKHNGHGHAMGPSAAQQVHSMDPAEVEHIRRMMDGSRGGHANRGDDAAAGAWDASDNAGGGGGAVSRQGMPGASYYETPQDFSIVGKGGNEGTDRSPPGPATVKGKYGGHNEGFCECSAPACGSAGVMKDKMGRGKVGVMKDKMGGGKVGVCECSAPSLASSLAGHRMRREDYDFDF